jgi:hypothetical protein
MIDLFDYFPFYKRMKMLPPNNALLPTELVIRRSCGCPDPNPLRSSASSDAEQVASEDATSSFNTAAAPRT